MDRQQVKNSGILVFSNLAVNLANFLKQVIMAYFLGVSAYIDILLLSQIVPAIFQSMIGGGAGEVLVIKREKSGYSEGSFEIIFIVLCLIPVIILSTAYFFSLNLLIPFFGTKQVDETIFRNLTLIFLLNALPGTFTSILRPHLYSKGRYSFYAISTVISQLAGIVFILATINSLGIFSFAWGTLIANFLNSIWFSFKSGLPLPALLNPAVWKYEIGQLVSLMKKVFSLSLQTFLNYFGTFWERSLSVKYLSGGYLSSLNYSKTLSELPNAVLLSSVLTTSYIEQVKLHKADYSGFATYTSRTLKLLIRIGFLFQVIMLVMAPAIIILIFRRGKFDNQAVESTLIIFNILTISFLLKLLMGFFSRTMYIIGEYRKLLYAVFFKFLIQLGIMVAFITVMPHAIPLAIVSGHLFISIYLFVAIRKKIDLPSLGFFISRLVIITISSALLLAVHSLTLHYYIGKSNTVIFLFSLPLILIWVLVLLWFLHRNGIDTGIIKKVANSWKKLAK